MRQKPSLSAIFLLVALLLSHDFTPVLLAQDAAPTPDQLDQLLAPVALYPDALLAQITTASTSPQQILDVANWIQVHSDLQGAALTDAAQKQGFDPAFIALVNFPTVLDMMAQNIDDYAAIGQAFMTDQAAVAASVQRLRARAYAAGGLRTNAQQTVVVQQPAPAQTVYVIQPVNPQVVYVPQYNPTTVYVAPSSGAVAAAAVISFGAGIAIGALMASNQPWGWGGWGWNWGSHRAYYNHTVWVGWGNPYRPPQLWYRPRPVVYTSRPGYGGNWGYRPPNYRPPYNPGYRPVGRPVYGPGYKPGYRPPVNNPGRPPVAKPYQPPANRPGQQPVTKPYQPPPNKPPAGRPVTKPSQPPANNPNRPPTTKPYQPPANKPAERPATRPSQPPATRPSQPPATRPSQPPAAKPSQPAGRPQGRPQPQNKPQAKPAPPPKEKPKQ